LIYCEKRAWLGLAIGLAQFVVAGLSATVAARWPRRFLVGFVASGVVFVGIAGPDVSAP